MSQYRYSDGELAASPTVGAPASGGGGAMDFSLSSGGEGGGGGASSDGGAFDDEDSLLIKPPQAQARVPRGVSGGGGGADGDRRRRRERERERERRHRHREERRRHRRREDDGEGRLQEHHQLQQQQQHQQLQQQQQLQQRRRDEPPPPRRRDETHEERQRRRHRRKERRRGDEEEDATTGAQQQQQQPRGRHHADKELEDLRSRLLSKRRSGDGPQQQQQQLQMDEKVVHKHRDGRRKQELQMELSPERDASRLAARLPELDKTQLERREKLLQTEREMSHRKKMSREALAARREKLKEIIEKRSRSPSPPHRKRRRHSRPPSPKTPSDVVTVSDASDNAEGDATDRSENSEDENGSGSSSESSSDSTDESATEEEEEDDEEEEEEEDEERDRRSHKKSSKKKYKEKEEETKVSEPEHISAHQLDTSPGSVHSDTPNNAPYREHLSRSRSRSRSNSFSPPPAEENGNETELPPAQPEEPPQPSPPPEPDERDSLPPYYPAIQGCRSVEEFQCLNRIEEGTYGVVYRARDKTTDEIVALKRLKMEKEKEGFPITSLREINTLLKGQHPNIVTVREIVVGSNMDKIFIVMDYVEHDLKGLMETMRSRKQFFLPGEVKCLMQQLLRAVDHLHDNWILHRDLKTSNLLLSHKGILKVGDFGLAREYGSPLKNYTPVVVTLWYRAPELLLGTKQYSTPIDVWSVGCIFAEFITMHALFPGKSEVDQLNKIFKELGTPNETIWPGWGLLSGARATWADQPGGGLRSRVGTHLSEAGLKLLNGLLTYDPQRRCTAGDALSHAYFKEQPTAIDPAMFPTWPAKSEGGRRHQHSPKPPSGGDQYKLLRDEDQAAATAVVGFHMGRPAPAAGPFLPPIATGFSLKF